MTTAECRDIAELCPSPRTRGRVTHLPQIACYADHHAKVTKLASHDRTVTSVEVLDGEARVTELSQMLGSDSGATRTSALEMLLQAKNWKESKRVYPMQETLA